MPHLTHRKRLVLELLETRQMLAFTAPEILIADDAGHLQTAEDLSEAAYRTIMTQSDGKIVVAGTALGPGGNDDFYLARYLANGVGGFVLDASFGTGGVVYTNFASGGKPDSRDDVLRGAAIDSLDRIVVAGEFRGQDVIARYTANGQLDTSFSGDGYDSPGNLINETEGNDWRIAFDSQDAPVVAAITRDGSLSYAVFRYDAAGNFDSQLGLATTVVRDGVVGSRYDRHRVTDIAVYPDSVPEHAGKIVLTGSTLGDEFDPAIGQDVTRRDWAVIRLNTDGSLDASFDGDGILVERVYDTTANPWIFADGSAADTSMAYGVLIDEVGQLVVSGLTAEGMTIARYNPDGSRDLTFNPGGAQPGRLGFNIPGLGHVDHSDGIAGELATSVATDSDGNYVLGGFWIYRGGDANGDGALDDHSGTLDRFAFARVTSEGSLDTTFGDNGAYLSYVGAGGNRMVGLVVNNSGEIWAAGYDADRNSILFRFAEQSDNQSPVAVDDAFATDEDTPLGILAPGLLANDTDLDGDALSVIAFDAVSARGAAVSVASNGGFTYDPRSAAQLQSLASGQSLQDSFTYTISDGRGGNSTATVTVTVDGLDEPPASDTQIYIHDIRFDSKRGGRDYRAVVEIRDINGSAVAGVSLKVEFAGTTYTLQTDSSGIARTDWVRNLSGNYYADAYALALEDYFWEPFALDNEDDSDADGWADDLLVV